MHTPISTPLYTMLSHMTTQPSTRTMLLTHTQVLHRPGCDRVALEDGRPESILKGALDNHYQMVKQIKGESACGQVHLFRLSTIIVVLYVLIKCIKSGYSSVSQTKITELCYYHNHLHTQLHHSQLFRIVHQTVLD